MYTYIYTYTHTYMHIYVPNKMDYERVHTAAHDMADVDTCGINAALMAKRNIDTIERTTISMGNCPAVEFQLRHSEIDKFPDPDGYESDEDVWASAYLERVGFSDYFDHEMDSECVYGKTHLNKWKDVFGRMTSPDNSHPRTHTARGAMIAIDSAVERSMPFAMYDGIPTQGKITTNIDKIFEHARTFGFLMPVHESFSERCRSFVKALSPLGKVSTFEVLLVAKYDIGSNERAQTNVYPLHGATICAHDLDRRHIPPPAIGCLFHCVRLCEHEAWNDSYDPHIGVVTKRYISRAIIVERSGK